MTTMPPPSPSVYVPFQMPRRVVTSPGASDTGAFSARSESDGGALSARSDNEEGPAQYSEYKHKYSDSDGGHSSASETPSPPQQPPGIYISEADMLALREWALSREQELSQQVTQRDEEVRKLQTRLAVSEAALREALAEVPEEEEEEPSALGELLPTGAKPRHSSRQANALAVALSTRRREQASARHKAEAKDMQAEWRAMRATLKAGK